MPEPFRINESGAVCRMYVDPLQWNVQPKQKRPPQEVSGYLLNYVIGSGAYSKVRLGVKKGSGRKVFNNLAEVSQLISATDFVGSREDNTEATTMHRVYRQVPPKRT